MNQRKQVTRDNHYVPQFYLKLWSKNGNTILCYDTVARNEGQKLWRSASIKHAATWRDFYTQHIGEELDDSIERYIEQHYETPAKECIQKLVGGCALDSEELLRLVDFAVLQMVRTPAWYSKTNEITQSIFADVMRKTVEEALADIREQRFDKHHQFDEYAEASKRKPFPNAPIETSIDKANNAIKSEIAIGRENYLASLGNTLNGTIAGVMRGYHWSILKTPDGFELPTSDNPFTRLAYRDKDTYDLDGGLGVRKVDLFMPLTPRHLLFTEVGMMRNVDPYLLWNDSARDLIIKAIVENATRYVYSRSEDGFIVAVRPRRIDPEYDDLMRKSLSHWDELQQ